MKTLKKRANKVMRTWEKVSGNIGTDKLTPGTNMAELLFAGWILMALEDLAADCAKICTMEAERLGALASEYLNKEPVHAARLSAAAVTAAKNARDIRALAQREEKHDSE